MDFKGSMKCHGTTTVGERGQVVLPAELRKEFKIEPGEKLIVLGADHNGFQRIVLMKSEAVTKMFRHLFDVKTAIGASGIEKIEEAIEKSGVKKLARPMSEGKKRRAKFKVNV